MLRADRKTVGINGEGETGHAVGDWANVAQIVVPGLGGVTTRCGVHAAKVGRAREIVEGRVHQDGKKSIL